MYLKKATKVLVVVADFPVLSQTFVLDQITGLIDRGFAVEILAARLSLEATVHSDVAAYRLMERVQCPNWETNVGRGIIPSVRLMLKPVRQGQLGLAWELLRVGLVRKLGRAVTVEPRQLLGYFRALQTISTPDVVLCHFGPQGDLMVRLRTVLGARWPIVTCFHGYDISMLLTQLGPHLYDRLFDEGDLFLPASEHFCARLLQLGAPAGKTFVQRMGVRAIAGDAMLRQAVAQKGQSFTFILVGRLVEKKGQEYAIRAIARCRSESAASNIRLVMIGDGPLGADLRRLTHELGIDDAVEFRGNQSRDQVLDALRSADGLVLPSVIAADGDMEASPVAISEAMSVGLPVVATRHGGIPEIVADGVTGLLVPERDSNRLAEAMLRVASDRQVSYRLGQAGRERVLRELGLNWWNNLLAERLTALAATDTPRH